MNLENINLNVDCGGIKYSNTITKIVKNLSKKEAINILPDIQENIQTYIKTHKDILDYDTLDYDTLDWKNFRDDVILYYVCRHIIFNIPIPLTL